MGQFAVLAQPGTELVYSLLAIHMIGATCVPIDPSFPNQRIKLIVDEINASAIIFSDEHSEIANKSLNLPAEKLSDFSKLR
ncbi:AMP-binding protein [Microbulbifer elongatus]|uniref:AMP-binding protein n=1 Tax=Microbulbifer elongatus TaxID=86173 RepID=UPI0039A62A88